MTEYRKLLDLASDAVVNAAAHLKASPGGLEDVAENLKRDVKVQADRQLESLIIERLSTVCAYPVLSEEVGRVIGEADSEGFCWIVDPLDGSFNFSRHIPICCLSIGLWKKDSPVLGVIYDFNRNEMFTGIVGEGAWLNEKPIITGDVTKVSEAVLCTGFPVSTDFSHAGVESFVNAIRTYKKIRLLGSAALSLAYVACGRADAYWENNIKIWDVAAGMAIVMGAGGNVEWKYAGSSGVLHVKASNASLPVEAIRIQNKQK